LRIEGILTVILTIAFGWGDKNGKMLLVYYVTRKCLYN